MTVEKYLELKCGTHDNFTFIKARARKDANTPFYHAEYQITPINTAKKWLDSNIKDYIVLNDKQAPIDWLSGASWNEPIKAGMLKCMLIISPTDFELLIPNKEQREGIEIHIDRIINAQEG